MAFTKTTAGAKATATTTKKAATKKATATETIDKSARADVADCKKELAQLKDELANLQSKLANAHKAAESGRLGSGIVNVFKNLR
jgi:molecular chaperone GrpE (heat shock protein)